MLHTHHLQNVWPLLPAATSCHCRVSHTLRFSLWQHCDRDMGWSCTYLGVLCWLLLSHTMIFQLVFAERIQRMHSIFLPAFLPSAITLQTLYLPRTPTWQCTVPNDTFKSLKKTQVLVLSPNPLGLTFLQHTVLRHVSNKVKLRASKAWLCGIPGGRWHLPQQHRWKEKSNMIPSPSSKVLSVEHSLHFLHYTNWKKQNILKLLTWNHNTKSHHLQCSEVSSKPFFSFCLLLGPNQNYPLGKC